jgi:hypothetical protein
MGGMEWGQWCICTVYDVCWNFMGTCVLCVCIVGATGCTCVVYSENEVFLIFGSRWPRAVWIFVVLGFTQSFLANCGARTFK